MNASQRKFAALIFACSLLQPVMSGRSAVEQSAGLRSRTPMPDGHGLGMCLWQEDNFLRLYDRGGIVPWGWGRVLANQPLVLGDVTMPNALRFRSSVSEAHPDRLTYILAGELDEDDPLCPELKHGDELYVTVTVSRLTSAQLFELQGARKVDLFAGDKTPHWMHKNASGGWDAGVVSTKWKLFDQAYPYKPRIALEIPGAPDKFAACNGGSVETGILPEEPGPLVESGDLEWLLLWYGEEGSWFLADANTKGDKAFLFVFSETPEISLVGGVFDTAASRKSGKGPDSAVRIEFAEPGAKFVVLAMPGFGAMPAAKTSGWLKKLPDEVRAQCEWWSKRLLEYPLAVEETFAFEAEKDELTIKTEFEFIALRQGGVRFAPLPPMLEEARERGFPLKFSDSPVKTELHLYCGTLAGIDNADGYTLTISGVGKYALEQRRLKTGGSASELAAPGRAALAELVQELDNMLEAGHLAPMNLPFKSAWGWNAFNLSSTRLLYSAPGQTLRVLAEAYPLLDDGRKAKVREYLAAERAAYPPETMAHLPTLEGAWREKWLLTEEWRAAQSDVSRPRNFHVQNNIVPAEALYDLAAYYGVMGTEQMKSENFDLRQAMALTVMPWIKREDWPTAGWRLWEKRDPEWWASYGWALDPDVNRLIAAYIGMSRLAAMIGNEALAQEGIYRLAKALTHRHARGFYPPLPHGPAMSDKNATSLIMTQWFSDASGPFTAMPAELGRFLSEHCRAEMDAYAKALEFYYADVYMAFGGPRFCTEWWHNYPEDSRQAFMLNAWVMGKDANWLYAHVDVPWTKVGDLFHIEKLSEIVKAAMGTEWKRLPF